MHVTVQSICLCSLRRSHILNLQEPDHSGVMQENVQALPKVALFVRSQLCQLEESNLLASYYSDPPLLYAVLKKP